MANQPFQWGFGGQQITSPEQAARQRALAESMIARSSTPASNWTEGLSDVASALTGTILNGRVGEAEAAGRASAGQALAGLSLNSDFGTIANALSNPWISPTQGSIASALLNNQISQNDPMNQIRLQQAQLEYENALNGGGNDETFFGTGIPIQNADGTISYGQFGNQGGFNIPELGPGQSFLTPVQQLNTGTGFTGVDKFGNQTGGVTPIDNFTPAQDSALGKVIGEAAAAKILDLPSTIATTNNMVDSIDGILNDPALDASTGWLSWMQAVPGTEQYRFGQRALQLQGQAFLQAFDSLKGGGQITEVEGAKATQAIGRLSTAQNAADYRDALNELKTVITAAKQRAINGAGSIQLPGNAAIQPNASPQAYPTVRVFNPATGRLE